MYKMIMVPTERPEMEKAATSFAIRLAQRFNSELRLVRVEDPPVVVDPATLPPVLLITEETVREARLARRQALEAFGAECAALGNITVTTALEEGQVGPTLRDHAEASKADLIVMSTHCRGKVQRMTLGSVTDYLIRNTHVPVLVAREPSGPADEVFNRIVVPLDGSTLAEEILPTVAELASRFQSTVLLLHVLTPVTYSQQRIMQPGFPWWDGDIASAQAYLDEAAAYLREKSLTVVTDVVLSEDISDAIVDYSIRKSADLVAIATRGLGGISRLVFGTVADEVTRKSPKSVLVFHPAHSLVREKMPEAVAF
jgi:nucleotide-binding universal stress UspA family protein